MDCWQRDDERTRTFDLEGLRAAEPKAPMVPRPAPALPRRIVEIAAPPSERDERRR